MFTSGRFIPVVTGQRLLPGACAWFAGASIVSMDSVVIAMIANPISLFSNVSIVSYFGNFYLSV